MPEYHSKLSKRSLTREDIEILRKINNPKVLKLQPDCIKTKEFYPEIDGYVEDFISRYINISKKGKDFNFLKKHVTKILRALDKEYRFKQRYVSSYY